MPITEERANEILQEEAVRKRSRTPDGDQDEAAFRKRIRRQVRRMKAANVEVVVPSLHPELDPES